MKYSWDDFNDIESTDLNIVWSGEIDVESSYAVIYLTVDSGWSSVNISVEGELIQADSNCSPCIVPLQLEQGKHSFEIDIHNHWHTTGSSALFSKAPPKKAA